MRMTKTKSKLSYMFEGIGVHIRECRTNFGLSDLNWVKPSELRKLGS